MNGKRVFLALPIEPVEPAAEKMEKLQIMLNNYAIRWVSTANYHLTLFFFGHVHLQQITGLSETLRLCVKNTPAFNCTLTGPGIFRNGKMPKVLWLGINNPDQLFTLKNEINNAVAELGFLPDTTVFRPHLTIGRFLSRQEITSTLESVLNDDQLIEPFPYFASKLILFESKLFPSGPQYAPIEVFPLKQ
jgi:RNA 2',3'-cyclic 3'-phosphodiesterase